MSRSQIYSMKRSIPCAILIAFAVILLSVAPQKSFSQENLKEPNTANVAVIKTPPTTLYKTKIENIQDLDVIAFFLLRNSNITDSELLSYRYNKPNDRYTYNDQSSRLTIDTEINRLSFMLESFIIHLRNERLKKLDLEELKSLAGKLQSEIFYNDTGTRNKEDEPTIRCKYLVAIYKKEIFSSQTSDHEEIDTKPKNHRLNHEDKKIMDLCLMSLNCHTAEGLISLLVNLEDAHLSSNIKIYSQIPSKPYAKTGSHEQEDIPSLSLPETISMGLTKLCPIMLFRMHDQEEACSSVMYRDDTPSVIAIWSFATLFVTIVCSCSLLGLLIVPLISKSPDQYIESDVEDTSTSNSDQEPEIQALSFDMTHLSSLSGVRKYHRSGLTFFEGLAVGSLVGSALFSLIPQAFELQERESNERFLLKALIIFMGLYLFFLSERIMRMIVDGHRLKKKHATLNASTTIDYENVGNIKSDVNNLNGSKLKNNSETFELKCKNSKANSSKVDENWLPRANSTALQSTTPTRELKKKRHIKSEPKTKHFVSVNGREYRTKELNCTLSTDNNNMDNTASMSSQQDNLDKPKAATVDYCQGNRSNKSYDPRKKVNFSRKTNEQTTMFDSISIQQQIGGPSAKVQKVGKAQHNKTTLNHVVRKNHDLQKSYNLPESELSTKITTASLNVTSKQISSGKQSKHQHSSRSTRKKLKRVGNLDAVSERESFPQQQQHQSNKTSMNNNSIYIDSKSRQSSSFDDMDNNSIKRYEISRQSVKRLNVKTLIKTNEYSSNESLPSYCNHIKVKKAKSRVDRKKLKSENFVDEDDYYDENDMESVVSGTINSYLGDSITSAMNELGDVSSIRVDNDISSDNETNIIPRKILQLKKKAQDDSSTYKHNNSEFIIRPLNPEISPLAWMVILGDALHNFIDGVSIGAAFSESILSGVSISVAVICEEFPHELGDFAVLISSGLTIRQALAYNFLSACTCYAGMVVGIIFGDINDSASYISALAGGMFLYIAMVNIMSELSAKLEETSRESIAKTFKLFVLQNLGIFLGIVIIFILSYFDFEP